jgi:hypothetical protein
VYGVSSAALAARAFRTPDGHNAAAMIDDVDRELPTRAGTAAEN